MEMFSNEWRTVDENIKWILIGSIAQPQYLIAYKLVNKAFFRSRFFYGNYKYVQIASLTGGRNAICVHNFSHRQFHKSKT